MVVDSKESLEALFASIGLDLKTAANVATNAKLSGVLREIIYEAGLESGCDKAIGNLLYQMVSKFPSNALVHRPLLITYVKRGDIKSVPQLEAAEAFLAEKGADAVQKSDLEAAAGVGVVVTPEQISAAVAAVVESERARLMESRYRLNLGGLLALVRASLPWADGKLAKAELDRQVVELLGPKTAEDEKPLEKPKKAPKEPKEAPKPGAEVGAGAAVGAAGAGAAAGAAEEVDYFGFLPDPKDNVGVHTTVHMSDGSVLRPANSRSALAEHLAMTGGRVVMRFPPEPNGYLHIGHAKAMHVDFGSAEHFGGACYLRYDDTNPEAEKLEYITHIEDIVSWMGWTPTKITYASDYFQKLYDLAVELIRRGKAYVCHQVGDEIKRYREEHKDSPWRDRPIEENIRIFDEMRRGLWQEGTATLRMKQDMRNENFNMYDLIAYRIKYAEHPHAGAKWCIYPSYDYTHCINDSLENVTHSLCTLEFESRRASYYWLLDALDLYKPARTSVVWEYSRLNITHNVLSKRKLNKLCTGGFVRGWTDPRLLTLAGLRRRGAPPEAINAFVRAVGVSRNENLISIRLLDYHIRDVLNRTAPRAMAVLHPLRVVLTNYPEGQVEEVDALCYPQRPGDPATYKLPFSRVLFIERSDFRLQDEKDYFGLAPGKTALLRYGYPITCTEAVRDASGEVVELRCEYDAAKSVKPKGVIHWVACPRPGVAPAPLEARLYDLLFKSEDPNAIKGDWLADMNPDSEVVVKGALASPNLAAAKVGDTFQLERLGYFCVDEDSVTGALVMNRSVTLKEASSKAAAPAGIAGAAAGSGGKGPGNKKAKA